MDKIVIAVSQLELDTIFALVKEKRKQISMLKSKHIKKINALYGGDYVADYMKALVSLEKHLEEVMNEQVE